MINNARDFLQTDIDRRRPARLRPARPGHRRARARAREARAALARRGCRHEAARPRRVLAERVTVARLAGRAPARRRRRSATSRSSTASTSTSRRASSSALLGRSGSGKTTLLRALAGLDRGRPARSRTRARTGASSSRIRGCCRGAPRSTTSRSACAARRPRARRRALAEVGLEAASTAWPRSSPAASASASRSPGRWCASPTCCCSTSRSAPLDALTRVSAQRLVQTTLGAPPAGRPARHARRRGGAAARRPRARDRRRRDRLRRAASTLPRPRRRDHPDLVARRRELLGLLGVETRPPRTRRSPDVHTRSCPNPRCSRSAALRRAARGCCSRRAVPVAAARQRRRQRPPRAATRPLRSVTLRVGVQKDGMRAVLAAVGPARRHPVQGRVLDLRRSARRWSRPPAPTRSTSPGSARRRRSSARPPGSDFKVIAADREVRQPREHAARAQGLDRSRSFADLKGKKIAVPKGSSANGYILERCRGARHRPRRTSSSSTSRRPTARGVLLRRGRRLGGLASVRAPGRCERRRRGRHGRPARRGTARLRDRLDARRSRTRRAAALSDFIGRLRTAYAWAAANPDEWAAAWSKESGLPSRDDQAGGTRRDR